MGVGASVTAGCLDFMSTNVRTCDAVLVAELLELRLAPRVNELVGERSVGVLCALLGARRLLLHAQVGQAGIAADQRNKLVSLNMTLAFETNGPDREGKGIRSSAGAQGCHEYRATPSTRILAVVSVTA